jgi:hypothetical protein
LKFKVGMRVRAATNAGFFAVRRGGWRQSHAAVGQNSVGWRKRPSSFHQIFLRGCVALILTRHARGSCGERLGRWLRRYLVRGALGSSAREVQRQWLEEERDVFLAKLRGCLERDHRSLN